MKREKTRPRSIRDVLGKATRGLGIDTNIKRYGLWEKWGGIVGAEIAAHARPFRWQGHVLVVRVKHPAWIQELSYFKPQMLERIRASHPEAELLDIRFEVGELPAYEQAEIGEETLAPRMLSAEEREFIERTAQEIDDPEIREAAERAMRRSMSRKGTR